MDVSPYYYAYTRGLPSCTQHSQVGFVTPLGVLLSGGEEFVCLFRELFSYRSETNLTLEIVLSHCGSLESSWNGFLPSASSSGL